MKITSVNYVLNNSTDMNESGFKYFLPDNFCKCNCNKRKGKKI